MLRFIFLTNLKYFGIFRPISVFETIVIIKVCKFTVFSSGSFCQIYRVTDEALIAETMVWSNFFLMNVFFALKGSKLFIIIPVFSGPGCQEEMHSSLSLSWGRKTFFSSLFHR